MFKKSNTPASFYNLAGVYVHNNIGKVNGRADYEKALVYAERSAASGFKTGEDLMNAIRKDMKIEDAF